VFLQAGFLNALPHVLISERPVYSNSLKSSIIHISEFQTGSRVIVNEIAKCIRSFKRSECENPLACVIPAMPTHSDKLVLSRSEETIYINGIEIANIDARLKFHVLNAIIDAFAIDFREKTVTRVRISHIAKTLRKLEFDLNSPEDQISDAIQNIRISLKKNSVNPDDFFDKSHGAGYRLNAEKVLIKNS
jgi:hypothetical protein